MTRGDPAFHVLIPARYASSRLPGKPLADLGGKPMVVRVCERAAASGAHSVCVATDDARIAEAVRAGGFEARLTRADHPSGTDRIAEAAAALGIPGDAIVVNVQGDEPLIAPALIARVARALDERPDAAVATACHPLRDAAAFANPNVVKVVLDAQGYALYFSRAGIPHQRERGPSPAGGPPIGYRHVGIYAYRAHFLARYGALQPAPIEKCEALEQLRALWHGLRIAVAVSDAEAHPGVDTLQDLEAVRRLLAEEKAGTPCA